MGIGRMPLGAAKFVTQRLAPTRCPD